MSVYTFLEVDVNRQIEEMWSYLQDIGADIPAERSQTLEDDLAIILKGCGACFTTKLSNKDVEEFLNSIVSVLIVIPAGTESENLILSFCQRLSSEASEPYGKVCLKVLNLIFQALPENLGVRYQVYYSMIELSGKIGRIDSVYDGVEKVRTILNTAQPPPSSDQMQQLLRLLYQGLLSNKKSEEASRVMFELLGTYTKENASQARDDAHKCIIASLSDPETFIMDDLLSLMPVKILEGELLHDLLIIFVSEKLPAYLQFYKKNQDYVKSIGLNHEANIEKMRLLTFIQMAESMSDMSFDLMVKELQIESNEVESFIISAIKTGLVSGRIDHSNGKVNVSSSVQRTFGKSQWQNLKEILVDWKTKLSLVKESMENIASLPMNPAAQ